MKTNRNFGAFETTNRRRRGVPLGPIVGIVVLLLVIGFFWLIWSRGGEQAQIRVEKAIPAEKLGK